MIVFVFVPHLIFMSDAMFYVHLLCLPNLVLDTLKYMFPTYFDI